MSMKSDIRSILESTVNSLNSVIEVTDTSDLDPDTGRYQTADDWAAQDFLQNICFNTHRSIAYHKKQIADVQSEALDLANQRDRDWGERQETALSRKMAYLARLNDRNNAVEALLMGAKTVLQSDFAVAWKPHAPATNRAKTQTAALMHLDALKVQLESKMSPKDKAAKDAAEKAEVPARDEKHIA